MTDWEIAENMVAKATGGTKTPGSGNKNVKGDVRLRNEGWMFEVKQTSKGTISVVQTWFRKLEVFRSSSDLCLVLFFELRGYPYYFRNFKHEYPTDWKSCKVAEEDLPEAFYTTNGIWEKDDWSSLYELSE